MIIGAWLAIPVERDAAGFESGGNCDRAWGRRWRRRRRRRRWTAADIDGDKCALAGVKVGTARIILQRDGADHVGSSAGTKRAGIGKRVGVDRTAGEPFEGANRRGGAIHMI